MKINSRVELASEYSLARDVIGELIWEYTDTSVPMDQQSKYYNALIKAIVAIDSKLVLLDPQDDIPF